MYLDSVMQIKLFKNLVLFRKLFSIAYKFLSIIKILTILCHLNSKLLTAVSKVSQCFCPQTIRAKLSKNELMNLLCSCILMTQCFAFIFKGMRNFFLFCQLSNFYVFCKIFGTNHS